MKHSGALLLACALYFGVAGSAFADSTTTIQTTSGSGSTITTSTTSRGFVVNSDPAVAAALAQLDACYSRYDMLINGILTHSQRVDFAAMEKHSDWFYEHALDNQNRNGYLAYLEQRLHLDADQEAEAGRIEGHFLVDALPLWTAYQTALSNAWTAWRESQVTRVTTTTSTTTIAAPAVDTTTTTVERSEKVEVKAETVTTPKRFIRNKDMK